MDLTDIPLQFPTSQKDYFSESYLHSLFHSRITLSRGIGRDGMRIHTFREKLADEISLISRKVLSECYHFTPFKERLISRGAHRTPRQISIPTIRDRLALRATCDLLSKSIQGARSHLPHKYIKSIKDILRTDAKFPMSFIRVDVRDFFPSIDHKRLGIALNDSGIEKFATKLIEGAISTPTGRRRDELPETIIGVPQGLSISNILSAIYMIEFDKIHRDAGYHYFRYVDDILIICESHLATKIYKSVALDLQRMGLESHAMNVSGKTEIRRLNEGIDYLGYNFLPSLVSVRNTSYQRMFSNISKVFTQHKYKRNVNSFLFRLNLKISGCIVDGRRRGWIMFFSQTENISQLRFLDEFVKSQINRSNFSKKIDVKRFVKAYHEIRYKGDESSYIPNFDKFDFNEKISTISNLTGIPELELQTRSVEAIDDHFKSLISKEIEDLEQDIIGATS